MIITKYYDMIITKYERQMEHELLKPTGAYQYFY